MSKGRAKQKQTKRVVREVIAREQRRQRALWTSIVAALLEILKKVENICHARIDLQAVPRGIPLNLRNAFGIHVDRLHLAGVCASAFQGKAARV